MTTHHKLWKFTLLLAAVALIVFGVREGMTAMRQSGPGIITAEERAARIQSMMSLLERDPRARLTHTQQAVESVARLAGFPEARSAEVYYALALRAHYGASDYTAAETAYRQAIENKPTWPLPHNGLGITLFEMGRQQDALEAFDRAMELDPDWSRPYSDLAILYRLEGRLNEAEEAARKALELEPENGATQNNYGVILDMMEREKEARERYEAAMALEPNLPSPYYNLACSYAQEGNEEAAIPLLERAIQLDEAFRVEAGGDPDFDPLRESSDFIRLMAAGDF